tara:strand:+ start:2210 stop:2995 length:786 start_codon:yes stop_codon:yes gene_type:complete
MKLYGERAPLEGVKAWMKNPIKPLILWGGTGVGKTATLDTIGSEQGMQSEEHENPLKAIENARHPTFFGKGRYARLEDCEYFNRSMWSKIESTLSHAPAIAFTPLSLSSIPYSILKQCVVIQIKNPQPRHILAMLESHDIEPNLSQAIAKSCLSWRQVKMLVQMKMKPSNNSIQFTQVKDQPKAILRGDYPDPNFDCHPLAVLEVASHNGVSPDSVLRGLTLHSNAWNIEGLSQVSKAYIATLRADKTDSPPFSKRKKTNR